MGLLVSAPLRRKRTRQGADIGATVARYMVERDREAAKREAEALSIARSNRRWARIAGIAAVASLVAIPLVAILT